MREISVGDNAADSAVFFASFPMDAYTPNLESLDAVMALLWVEGAG
jgi:hypothetical protein